MNQTRLGVLYGSNVPIRAALVLAALFWAAGLALVATTPSSQAEQLMADARPLIWSLVFCADAGLLIWRLIERKQRPHVGRLINALTCTLWLAITVATASNAGFLAAAGGMTFFLMSAWTAARTDLTSGDRETV